MNHPTAPPLTAETYHAHPAWSASRLKFARTHTMRAYWDAFLNPDRVPKPPTEAMRQGSLCDCVITTPEIAEARYIVMPADLPRRPTEKQLTDGKDSRPGTKAHDAYLDAQDREAQWVEFEARRAGRELVSADWWDRALAIRDVLMSDPEIRARLDDALVTSQLPHLWRDGLRECRYMPDLETAGGGLWDLKKAASASPRAITRQTYDLAYDIQLAHYREGFSDRHGEPPRELGLIAYEWEPPHDYALLPASDDLVALGMKRREEAFERVADCMAADKWPSHGTVLLDPPSWLKDSTSSAEGGVDPSSIVLF